MLIETGDDTYRFTWNPGEDQAEISLKAEGQTLWTGSLLPVFWLRVSDEPAFAVKATCSPAAPRRDDGQSTLALVLDGVGTGQLSVSLTDRSVRLTRLTVTWHRPEIAIVSVHWGCDVLTPAQRAGAPTLDLPFWPTWRSEGFGIAGAKTNPMQSFFRSWDFGHANIPLGSFGPAMGTPYGAAYPRPTYAASMGGRHGWVCFGPGAIPPAALTLQIRSRSAAIEWLFREDLWGAPTGFTRTWENPLGFAWADTAWKAYLAHFRLLPVIGRDATRHQKSFWGTWGDFRVQKYAIPQSVDRAVDQMGADLICIDDPWESTKGSCRPHPVRFPEFARDIAYAHQRGIGVGIWMPIGWIEDPAAEGLTEDDLLLTRDGVPIRSNWATDPREEGPTYFCLDPSSAKARVFLRNRTQRVMRDYRPTLLKIDFTYGIPGPDGCSPRDSALRGEQLAWTFARLVGEAARQIDPSVTLFSYSLSPLWDSVQDQCALDDLGDAGVHEAAAHGQWSVWAALLGERGRPIMASSGYHWSSDTDNLLNTAVIGAAGANLPSQLADGSPLPPSRLARRRALFRWHRRTVHWTPLWLDSAPGDLEQEGTPRNWGRLETNEGLTALALREPSAAVLTDPALQGTTWSGSWAIIAQDKGSIFEAATVAVVPFAPGCLELSRARQPRRARAFWATRPDTEASWTWIEGRVQLEVDATDIASDLVGFTVSD